MKNKDSGARTGLAPAANSTSTPSPVEVERKRRRRRTNSTAAADTSYQSTANSSLTTPNDTSLATPTSSAPAAQPAVPSTPPTQAALPPTPVKRQQRTPSKNSAVVTEGEDSQDDTIDMQNDADGQGSMDNESSSKKKKLVILVNILRYYFMLTYYSNWPNLVARGEKDGGNHESLRENGEIATEAPRIGC